MRRGLPPGRRAVGRCQVDGMPHDPRCGLAEQTRSERHTSARHVGIRASTNAQVSGYVKAQDDSGRASVSAFGTSARALPHERSVGYLLGVNDTICSKDTRRTSLNGL